jgi:hypothetical protein
MTVFLDGIGQVDILITQGNVTAITYGDAFMPVNFADKNPYPYIDGGYAVFKDEDENVYLGIEVPS